MSILSAIWARITDEPVLVTALVTAALNLWIAYGHLVTQEQQGAILALVGGLLALFVRGKVTPTT